MRLRIKYILIFIVIGLVQLLYLDQIWIKNLSENDSQLYKEQRSKRLASLSKVLIPLIEKSGDIKDINEKIDFALSISSDWKDIRLLDNSGVEIAKVESPLDVTKSDAEQNHADVEPFLKTEYKIISKGSHLATIELEYLPNSYHIDIHRSWEAIIGWTIVIYLVFSIFFFESLIIRPISRVARAIWALQSGEYRVRIPKARNDEVGALVTSFSMMRDAVQKREKAMNANTERMQSIFDRAVDGIFVTDHTGVIESLNPSAQRMLGCEKGRGIGENIDTFAPGVKARLEQGDFHSREEDGISEGHPVLPIEGVKADGSPISIEVGISRLMHGNKVKYIGMFRDVTNRMKMEMQLAEYTSELEAKNVLLDHALEDIRAASRAKTEFLANTSDEIRTPMNGVLGMLTLLKQEALTVKQMDLVDAALSSGNAMLAVINDVLDFSKVESGKLDFDNINFDMRRIIEELCRVYERVLVDKPVNISCMISPGVPTMVCGDPTRFRQIINNLLSNAIKYTQKGEIILRADKVAEDSEEDLFEIQVVDTGSGIPAEKLEVIAKGFNMDIDPDSEVTDKTLGGYGLGLSICKRLVNMFDGEIGVDSKEGEGSTFWFTIKSQKVSDLMNAFKPIKDIKGLRVCCVDDNPTSLEILERVLESKGILCTTFSNAEDALRELRQAVVQGNAYDLAILDRNMPGIDGIELAGIIRNDLVLSKIKLVLLTSVSVRGDGKLAREAGFNGYFTKPITQAQIYDCISTVMGIQENQENLLVTRHTLQETEYRSRRILLVEDNIINQKVALGLLLKLGYHADVATNGQEAVTAASKQRYDAVIMDCEMPVMSGYQATEQIREYEEVNGQPPVPIIALTAHAAQGYREKCIKSGMNDHLTKPVRLEKLQQTLDRWLMASEGTEGININ
ncbi:MAG: PAS domain-containing sensor histidine kinase [Gammaproteobacteria bacterium]|mgnify:CR=1 FL=1|nr:MAG: PAS domain-containing sensor histidine kinase [Gammaproteobacteria bacterium]